MPDGSCQSAMCAAVTRIWSEEDLSAAGDLARLYRNSYVEGRSGDLLIQTRPDCQFTDTGTSHGTPYDYDRNVPLIFFGGGIKAGSDAMPARSVDIAPSLAAILGIPYPIDLEGKKLNFDKK